MTLFLLSVVLLAGTEAIAGEDEKTEADPRARWQHQVGDVPCAFDYASGLRDSQFSGKPMLLFVTKAGDARGEQLGEVLADRTVRKGLESFVVILIDMESDPEHAKEFDAHRQEQPIPYFRFVSSKEVPLGQPLGYVGQGPPPPPMMPQWFLKAASEALQANGPVRPSKAYTRLTKESKKLDKAMKAERYATALKSIAKIEKVGYDGVHLSAAREARAKIEAAGNAAFATAKATLQEDSAEGRKQLLAVAKQFKGLPVADEAKKLAKE